MLYKGEGIKKNKKEALQYFKLGVKQKYVESIYYYGLMLYEGEGIEQSKKSSITIFQKSSRSRPF